MTSDPLSKTIFAMQQGAQMIAYTLPPGGDWRPVATVLREAGNIEVVQIDPAFLASVESKQRLAGELAKLVGRQKCRAFAFIVSAWLKYVDDDQVAEFMRKGLKDDPDKKEVLSLQGFAIGQQVSYIAEIQRPPGGHPNLGPWKLQPNPEIRADRYAGGIVQALQAWLN